MCQQCILCIPVFTVQLNVKLVWPVRCSRAVQCRLLRRAAEMTGPVSRTGWWMWVKLVKAGLGVILGAIAFFIFTFVYGNIAAGAWALISAMFAGLVLHLHIVYKHHRLELYYSAYR